MERFASCGCGALVAEVACGAGAASSAGAATQGIRPTLPGLVRSRGAAALYYAAFSLRETGMEEVWVIGSLIICASVLVHGVTATPLTKLYGKLRKGR
jgi:hypothetical protein